MNIVFMGTNDFSVPSLKELIQNYDVKAVFTQPDRPKGRGNKLSFPPVKELAIKEGIPVYQPEKIRNDAQSLAVLKEINPDFIIVVAFGQILPKEIIELPKFACINLHASLLPKYRGAAPINWSIVKGEMVTGNTTMLMDVGLDTGDMLLKQEVEITDTMTAGELHDILMENGSKLLIETIEKYVKGEITPIKQDDGLSSYASMIKKENAKIDWNKSSTEISCLVRGFYPWPIAFSEYENVIMKVYEVEVLKEKSDKAPGSIIKVTAEGIKVASKDGVILIKKIQFPGKKAIEVKEYIKGNNIKEGITLK